MTAAELENLLAEVPPGEWVLGDHGRIEVYRGFSEADRADYWEAVADVEGDANARLIAMAPTLARKVIAADKLAEALRGLSSAREAETEYAGRMYTLCSDCGAQLSERKPHSEDCGWSLSDAALAAYEAAQ